jgi:hypothetical protein
MYARVRHAEDVLKQKLDPTILQVTSPFYANALEAWQNMNFSGQTLVFNEAWSKVNVRCIGDFLKENGHWKNIEDINTGRCTQPTIRRLAANLNIAEAFYRHHYPNLTLQSNPLTSSPLPLPSNNAMQKLLHFPQQQQQKKNTSSFFY